MQLMRAMNIGYSIGERTLLEIGELSIHHGDRIGLVGKNGAGKTLLLRCLLGEVESSANVDFHSDWSWFRQLDSPGSAQKNWGIMSGGEKTMEKLSRIFSEGTQLLFLDEPTNNLDWRRIEKLEQKLKQHKGAFVIVSHDRALLDNVCTAIWELEAGNMSVYNGDYSFYSEQKELERKQQYMEYESYLREKKRLTERLTAKRTQAKGMRKPPARMSNSEWQLGKNKAAGKQKKVERVTKVIERRIERLEKVDKPFEWDEVKMNYVLAEPIHSKNVFTAKDLKKRDLFTIPVLKLKTGSKTALIGDNGCGKTTLLNHLLMKDGDITFSKQANVGHFDQTLEKMPQTKTIIEYVSESSSLPEHLLRIILGRLRFTQDEVHKKIGILSGGERVKVALARLLTGDFNVLVLDEPTNHIDLEAMEALENLVQDYPGTILYVTHDRRFVERTATKLWIMEDKTVTSFGGSYNEYLYSQNRPAQVNETLYDKLTLETKLTELISRISMPRPGEDVSALEQEYDEVLEKLKQFK